MKTFIPLKQEQEFTLANVETESDRQFLQAWASWAELLKNERQGKVVRLPKFKNLPVCVWEADGATWYGLRIFDEEGLGYFHAEREPFEIFWAAGWLTSNEVTA
jgi:hypothetical protein